MVLVFETVHWEAAVDGVVLDGGSGGAVRVTLPTGSVVVKNAGVMNLCEVNAAWLCDYFLQLPLQRERPAALLSVPRTRLVTTRGIEGQAIVRTVRELLSAHLGIPAEAVSDKLCLASSKYILVMEYIEHASSFINASAWESFGVDALAQSSCLGEIAAFDTLMNNWDRFPVAWVNNGNLSNVLLTSERMVLIDQAVFPIKIEEKERQYREFVRQVIASLVEFRHSTHSMPDLRMDSYADLKFIPDCLKRLRHAVQRTGNVLSMQMLLAFTDGYLATLRSIAQHLEREAAQFRATTELWVEQLVLCGVPEADASSVVTSNADFVRRVAAVAHDLLEPKPRTPAVAHASAAATAVSM